jgi:hypothetical protein
VAVAKADHQRDKKQFYAYAPKCEAGIQSIYTVAKFVGDVWDLWQR